MKQRFEDVLVYLLKLMLVWFHFLSGNVHLLRKNQPEMVELADQEPDRTVKIRIGIPPLVGFNLYHMMPNKDPVIANNQLKTLMALPDADARRTYTPVSQLTHSVMFLSMHDEAALPYRQRFVKHLDRANILQQAEKAFPRLLAGLEKIDRYNSSTRPTALVREHVLKTLALTLTGFDYPEALSSKLRKIEDIKYVIMPTIIAKQTSFYKELQVDINAFIRVQLIRLRDTVELQEAIATKQFAATVILDRFPELQSFKDMNDAMIEQLIHDAELRSAVTSTMAFDFLGKALETAFNYVFDIDVSPSNELLREEINGLNAADEPIASSVFLNKEKMPVLHAIYLEALRYNTPFTMIPRYTHSGINTPEMTVPPRTLVLFDNQEMLNQCAVIQTVAHHNRPCFDPERFLVNRKTLSEDAILQQGHLTPFGVGRRACPASVVVEALIKFHLIRAMQSTEKLSPVECVVKKSLRP